MHSFWDKRLKGNVILYQGTQPRECPRAATIYAIVPSVRLTHFRKLAVFNGHGTFYKG